MIIVGRPQIAVLASGSGSTLETFVHATHAGLVAAEVGLVICNNSRAGAFNRVARLNSQYGTENNFPLIGTKHISGKTHPGGASETGVQTQQEAEAIAELTDPYDLILCLGYMKKQLMIGKQKINTHPGPLPLTKGLHGIDVQKKVLEVNYPVSAQTLHLVDEDYDTGRILAEHPVPVLSDDTPESLFDAVQLTEKTHIIADIGRILSGEISLAP